jgi:hypothetical protein
LIAAALLTVSPFAIAYAQEARAYTLLMLTATLFTGAAYELAAGARARSLSFILAGAALLYSHPYGTLVFVSVCGALFAWMKFSGVGKDARRDLLVAAAKSFALFLPWALILALVTLRLQTNGFWIPRPTPAIVLSAITSLVGSYALVIAMTATLIAAFGVWLAGRGELAAPLPPAGMVALASAAFGPMAIGLLLSLVSTPIFTTRYFSGSLPPFLVLVAAAATYLLRGRSLAIVVLAGFASLAAYTFWVGDKVVSNQDWRGAIGYVAADLDDDDCVVAPWGIDDLAVDHYLGRAACRIAPPVDDLETARLQADTVYLVGRPDALRSILRAARNAMPDGSWEEGRRRFRGVDVRTFVRR